MNFPCKRLLAPVIASASILSGMPVSAATIVIAFHQDGTLPSTELLKTNTYDFTFVVAPPVRNDVVTTLSISARTAPLAGALVRPVKQLPIQYQMYTGDPGHGAFLAQSTWDIEPLVSFNPVPGRYYVEITPRQIDRSFEVVSGQMTTSTVPEPSTWMLLLIGVAGLGAGRRVARRTLCSPVCGVLERVSKCQ
jgi:hypothetical protein